MHRPKRLTALCLTLLIAASSALAGAGDDSREGYYYPPVTSDEVFRRDIGQGPPTDRLTRIAFVTQLTNQQHAAPTPPRIAIFAKGGEAEHMISRRSSPASSTRFTAPARCSRN